MHITIPIDSVHVDKQITHPAGAMVLHVVPPSFDPNLSEVLSSVKHVEQQLHDAYFGADQLGHGTKGTLVSPSTGVNLCTYHWPATAPVKGIVLLLHGHGSYVCYEFLRSVGVGKPPVYCGSWVEVLNAAGFTVVGLDLQSHGASEGLGGLRCYFSKFDDLVEDVIALTTCVHVVVKTPAIGLFSM